MTAIDPARSVDGPRLEQRAFRQGRLAYYAWGQLFNGTDPKTGRDLVPWVYLTVREQQAWVAAATAVRADTLAPDGRTRGDDPVPPWMRGPQSGESPQAQNERLNRIRADHRKRAGLYSEED